MIIIFWLFLIVKSFTFFPSFPKFAWNDLFTSFEELAPPYKQIKNSDNLWFIGESLCFLLLEPPLILIKTLANKSQIFLQFWVSKINICSKDLSFSSSNINSKVSKLKNSFWVKCLIYNCCLG